MRKNKESKKEHETIIGKIIYGVLLFAPLLAILSTCLYAILNSNAYETSTKEFATDAIRKSSNFENGEIYEVTNIHYNPSVESMNFQIYFDEISVDLTNTLLPNTHSYIGLRIRTYTGGTQGYYIGYYLNSNNEVTPTNIVYKLFPYESITFRYNSNYGNINVDNQTYMYQIVQNYTTNYDNVKNAFYYSIDQVENSNLFNWSKSTGMYQAVKTTTEGLGITNSFTPMLLTYWFMISIIYFIYDIGLMLIMIIHRKIHELQESV